MADKDISSQVKSISDLNAAATKFASTIKNANENFSEQSKFIAEMAENFEKIASAVENAKSFTEQWKDVTTEAATAIEEAKTFQDELNDSVAEGVKEATETTKASQALNEAINAFKASKLDILRQAAIDPTKALETLRTKGIEKLSESLDKHGLKEHIFYLQGAFEGLKQGMRNVLASGGAILGLLGGIADTFLSVGASIIAIPFKIFTGLVDMAAKAEAGSTELAQAIENVRKSFGNLRENSSRAVLETTKSMKGAQQSGLSTYRVFESIADKMNFIREVAEGMGATFDNLTGDFKTSGDAIIYFQKALGLSTESMHGLGVLAMSTGQHLADIQLDIAKQSLGLGEAFGISQKVIARDMGKAITNVKHFGSLTVKEIGTAVTYSRKLGIELEKITGILDAFDTFEGAAENAAKLGQSFGVTIDAMDMLQAQSPAEQIEMLRKQFAAAGVDASKMDRAQRALLVSSTGLDDATVKQAFSLKNAGVSLDDVKRKSDSSAKKQMTQTEALGKLADSIERVVRQMQSQMGSYLDQFLHGFMRGIQSSKEFVAIIRNIKLGLQQVFLVGVQAGRKFVEAFKPLKDILGGLAEFFRPEKFKNLFQGVSDEIIAFAVGITSPGSKWSFASLMRNIKKHFLDFFDMQTPAGSKILDGFKTIFRALSKIVAEGVRWAIDALQIGIYELTAFLRDPSGFLKNMSNNAKASHGFIMELLSPIIDAFKNAKDILPLLTDMLWPALTDAINSAIEKTMQYIEKNEKLKGYLDKGMKWMMYYFAATMLGPAVMQMFSMFLISSVQSLLAGGAATKALEKALSSSGLTKSVANAAQTTTSTMAATIEGSGKAANAAQTVSMSSIAKMGAKIVVIAGAIAISGVILAGAVITMKKILDAGGINSIETAAAPLAVLASIIAGATLVAGASALMSSIPPSAVLKGAIVIGVVGIIIALLSKLIAGMFQSSNPEHLSKAAEFLSTMTKTILVMAPLTLAAGALGAAVAATGGLGLAAIAGGLAILGTVTTSVTEYSIQLINDLKNVPYSADLEQKTRLFVSITEVLHKFVESFTKILGMLSNPVKSFVGLFRGNNLSDDLVAAQDFFRQLTRSLGGLVETLVIEIQKLKFDSTPELVNNVKLIEGMMGAIANIFKAITPSDQFIKSAEGVFTNVDFESLKEHLDKLIPHITGKDGIIQSLGNAVKDLTKDMATSIKPESVTAVAGLMSAIGDVIGKIMPTPELIKSFSHIKETFAGGSLIGGGGEKLTESSFDSAGIGAFYRVIIDVVSTVFNEIFKEGRMSDFIGSISMFDEKQIKSIGAAAGFLKIIFDIMNVVNSSLSGLKVGDLDNAKTVVIKLPSMKDVLLDISLHLGLLMKSMHTIINDFKLGENFKTGSEGIRSTLTVISDIIKGVNELKTAFSKTDDMESVKQKIRDWGGFVYDIFSEIGSVYDNISKVLAPAMAEPLKVVSNLTDSIIKMNAALGEAGKGSIKAKAILKDLVGTAGLGGKGVYSVQAKEVVVNLELQVVMDVDKVERVMIMRERSLIRDRLEFGIFKPTDEADASHKLPQKFTKDYGFHPVTTKDGVGPPTP